MIINAVRAYILQFQNLKRKLYNCIANIYFNKKQCLRSNLIPKFAGVKTVRMAAAVKVSSINMK